jgi:Fe-S cluster biogenesis protein NfuA
MDTAHNPEEFGARIEQLLDDLGRSADPGVREASEEVVRLLMELYGAALARTVELACEPSDRPVIDRLTGDSLVSSLLILHGLHPVDTETRVREALDGVRPYLGSHAGGVELLGIDDEGVVRLKLEGSCDGCPSSAVTVQMAIERAISEVAPEVAGVAVDGMVSQELVVTAGLDELPLLQIGLRPGLQPTGQDPNWSLPCPVPVPE